MTISMAACTGPAPPTASGDIDGTSMVIAEAGSPNSLDPLAGYAPYGAAKIFDGLLEHQPGSTLYPALAATMPEPSPNGRSWRVQLRDGVRFSDGTAFDADDVVATYRALLDPKFGSPLREDYSMLSQVDEVDAHTVDFTLNHPYAPFPDKLVLGISPSQKFAGVDSIARSSVGVHPVGTGPYELAAWHRGKSLTLRPNKNYVQGQPGIKKITVLFGLDDNARWEKVRKGEVDAAALPVNRTHNMQPPADYRVLDQRSAEFRAISLPTQNRVTGDTAMRRALNYAVNRRTIVDSVLGGKGSVASTPITDAMLEFVEPEARFQRDDQLAGRLLNGAGWKLGADGVRERRGVRARFPLYYPQGDSLAQRMAQRFAEDVAQVGVSVEPVATTDLTARAHDSAVLFGAGNPFDPDLSLFSLLHSTSNGVVSGNWSGYSDAGIDSALDYGQREIDPGQRAVAYRELQRAYLRDPAMVVLARIDHGYLLRESWTGYQAVTDAAGTDFTWGPWWNLQTWR
ncbi:MAG: ABC transporter substrate-binding protein [Sciscionella sp.]